MIEWLENFETQGGVLVANIVTEHGREQVTELGILRNRGVPSTSEKARQRAFTTSFSDWSPVPASRYLAEFGGLKGCGEAHTVFSFHFGRYEYLVPALVLMRGLFPLIPEAFAYAFTPRRLESLCIPTERNGHWTVLMPDFKGLYNARFRRPTVEALTWASLFPSARSTWQSAFKGAMTGQMRLELPHATVRLLTYGPRRGKTVHVTALVVNALLAHEAPFEFVDKASPSFVLNTNAASLSLSPNAYYEQHDTTDDYANYRLTDAEWQQVSAFCQREKAPRGRMPRDDARDIADGLLMHVATSLPWHEIPIPIAGDSLSRHWVVWKADGRLDRLFNVLRSTRIKAEYLPLSCQQDSPTVAVMAASSLSVT